MKRIAELFVVCAGLVCFSVSLPAKEAPASAQPDDETVQRIAALESCLPYPVAVKDRPQPCTSLEARMRALHVPGVSIAVIHHGAIVWAKGFGVAQIGGKPVTVDTLFQAGSISKPTSAMAALHLVQQGKLSLDADVNRSLTSWQLPPSPQVPGAVVTLRELLTHTAGLSVHGFPGYAANEPLPTLVQVLNGQKPANTEAVRLESMPGSEWKYSGGGYTVMQLLVQDVTKQAFAPFLHDTVLAPIGMSHSTFQQPLPVSYRDVAATPYGKDGKPIPGGAHTYPEQAAAGLWTTPSDLARLLLEIQQSSQGDANHVLDQDMTRKMLTPGKGRWGLGLEIGGSVADPYFGHGGSDAGFESQIMSYQNHGDGVAIMTNGEHGSQLVKQILAAVAAACAWPEFQPRQRAAVTLDRSELARYVGNYVLEEGAPITITLEGNQLISRIADQPAFPMFAESSGKFFTSMGPEFEFHSGADGRMDGIVLREGGDNYPGKRK